jgi:HEAT repeat protein
LAAISLGRIGGDAAGQLLLEALEARRAGRWADSTAAAIVWGLGEARYAKATGVLVEVLAQSPGEAAPLAAWSLGRAGSPEAARALLSAYWGPDLRARGQARRALVQMAGEPLAATSRYKEYDQEARFMQLRAQQFDMEGLMRKLKEQTEFSALTDAGALVQRQRGQVVAAARAALDGSDARAQAQVLADLNDPSGALGLGGQGDVAAVRALLTELSGSLRKLAGAGAERAPRAGALRALGALGQPEDRDLLLGAARDADAGVRQAALGGLGRGFAASPEAQAVIVEALRDPAALVRAEAARALRAGQPAGQSAQQRATLVALLEDGAAVVRLEAATTLGASRSPEAVAPLARAMSGSTREVQVAILGALGQIGTPEARDELKRWAEGGDLVLRQAAQTALGQ